MDEFAVDLDRVLDEFEQSEGGNAAEVDAVRREVIPDGAGLNQSRSAANFPAFPALDLDLAEADFAPSHFNFRDSPREDDGSRNFSDPIANLNVGNAGVPIDEAEPIQNNNENSYHVPELIDFQPTAQISDAVDVLSACPHAIVNSSELCEPCVMQEHHENEVENEVLAAAPPDIVCSAPDLVSSAIVGVDIVPLSFADANQLDNVGLNLDPALSQTSPVTNHLNVERPGISIQDVSNPSADLTPDISSSSAEIQVQCDLPCDQDVLKKDVCLDKGRHSGEPSDHLYPNTKESGATEEKHNVLTSSCNDVVLNSKRSDADGGVDNNSCSSHKSPAFLSEEDKTDQGVINGNSSASSGSSLPSDMCHDVSEANVSSALSCAVAVRSDVRPFEMVHGNDMCVGDSPYSTVDICSDINKKIWSHGTAVLIDGQEPLPDVSRISVSGVDLERGLESVSRGAHNTRHGSCDGPDLRGDKNVDREMIATDPDCLSSSVNGSESNPATSFMKNKMPPGYWDDAEGDKTQTSEVGQSYGKCGDLDDLGQTYDVSNDDSNVTDKTDDDGVQDGSCVTFSSKTDAKFSEVEDAMVKKDLNQETFKKYLNDPEIIKDGKVSHTNFPKDHSELTASVHDDTSQEIQSDGSFGSFEVPAETVSSECQNLKECVKFDLVSDVVILESLPEFCNSVDATSPMVTASDSGAAEVRSGSSEDESFTVVNGCSVKVSSPINDDHVSDTFGILEHETFKNLMNEVEEEMEEMINRENINTEVVKSHAVASDFEDVGRRPDCDDVDRKCKNSFEDQAVFVHCNGLENNQREPEVSVLKVTKKPSDDASFDVLDRLSSGLEPVCYREKEASNLETTKSSANRISADTKAVAGVESGFPFSESRVEDYLREAADDVEGFDKSADYKNDLPSTVSSQDPRPSEFSTDGAVQKQTKTTKLKDIVVVNNDPALPSDTVVISAGTQPVTGAPDAARGSSPHPTPTQQNSASHPGIACPTIPLCSNINLEITQLGKVAPVWLPDAEASKCMECEVPFSFTRRRHHCRACGKVFCHGCSGLKATLPYLENKQDRVCARCYHDLVQGTRSNLGDSDSAPAQTHASSESQSQRSVANPPTGVLRKQDSVKLSGEPKQVIFSDGVRPGGTLTELDGSGEVQPAGSRRSRKSDKSSSHSLSPSQARNSKDARRSTCLIPSSGLPLVIIPAANGEFSLKDNVPPDVIFQQISNAQDSNPVMFAINRDVAVLVTMVELDCCVNRLCWCFTTQGLCTVGQDEIVIVLECLPDEKNVPVDILRHLHVVYEMATHGNTVNNLDHTVLPPGSLGCREIGGFLYVRQTFQCLQKLVLPDQPYLFGLLLQKWEMSWAKVFPLRLMFRLGAEFRYYPCPLTSIRNRKPVFGEIGHTIMNLLADFHNYQYMVPRIIDLVIHMEDKRTTVSIPRSQYKMLMKILSNSDDHVIAIGASFSSTADSHLVCLQSEDGNYQTQAINILNRPRQVTGASFIVFNGALKPASGLRAKSSIVEDGLMVQVTSDTMTELRQVLSEMKDYKILCGSTEIAQPDEMVIIEWTDENKSVNEGVKSPIDGLSMSGVDSIRIHDSTDYTKEKFSIRWTEVFVISNAAAKSPVSSEGPPDVSCLAKSLAQACCQALVNHLPRLTFANPTKIGLRVTIDAEQVGYEIGSCGSRLPGFCMNDLDEKLISVIHGAASNARSGPIVLELIFHIVLPYGARSDRPATN